MINVGEYVRTNDRGIRRIGKIIDDLFYRDEEDNLHQKGNLIKSSQNIIDLIEVGDYVNGLKVDEIDEKGIYNYNSYDGWSVNIASCNEEIKSIVTHQQFSQMEYRIGE